MTPDLDPTGIYPKMLYRKAQGAEPMLEWEGRGLDHKTVDSEDQEIAAFDEGWVTHDQILDIEMAPAAKSAAQRGK